MRLLALALVPALAQACAGAPRLCHNCTAGTYGCFCHADSPWITDPTVLWLGLAGAFAWACAWLAHVRYYRPLAPPPPPPSDHASADGRGSYAPLLTTRRRPARTRPSASRARRWCEEYDRLYVVFLGAAVALWTARLAQPDSSDWDHPSVSHIKRWAYALLWLGWLSAVGRVWHEHRTWPPQSCGHRSLRVILTLCEIKGFVLAWAALSAPSEDATGVTPAHWVALFTMILFAAVALVSELLHWYERLLGAVGVLATWAWLWTLAFREPCE